MPIAFSFNLKRSRHVSGRQTPPQENGLVFEGQSHYTAIFIHGLTGTPQEMKFLATFFNRKGYAVSCPRLANHGKPIEILQRTTWQECYQSVREAFLKIKAAGQTDGIFVAGLSVGGLLALLLAEEFPHDIAGVTCLSPTLFYDGWNMPWYRHVAIPLLCFTPVRRFFYFKEEPPYGIKNEAIRRRVHNYYHRASLRDLEGVADYGYPYIPASLLYQLHLLVKYLGKCLPSIRVPVQLIQAKYDDMTSVKNSLFIYHRIGSELKEIELLHNSYHVITADQERDTVAEKMEEFFTRVTTNRVGTAAAPPAPNGHNGRHGVANS